LGSLSPNEFFTARVLRWPFRRDWHPYIIQFPTYHSFGRQVVKNEKIEASVLYQIHMKPERASGAAATATADSAPRGDHASGFSPNARMSAVYTPNSRLGELAASAFELLVVI
jgi:hypothetical protein